MTLEEVLPSPGGERVFQSVKSPWHDATGKIIGIFGVSRDITEQRRQTELGAANINLTALKFDLASLVGKLAKTDIALRDKAQAITSQIDGTIKTVRRISTELRPGMLDDFGLAAAIEWHAQEFQERTGIFCDCDKLMPEPPLSRAQATALFRIFQEAMTNVARHAKATRVRIGLLVEDEALHLQVEDNGRGMPPGALAGTHSLGVIGMRERASLLDGSLVISETPGGGTTVRVSIPLLSIPSDNGELVRMHEEP